MTAERDFIRKHPDTSSKAMILLASHVGLTITSRLIGKVRYYDRKKLRERIAKVPKRIVAARKTSKPWAPVPPNPTKADAGRNKCAFVAPTPAERQFIMSATEIGYERSCELLDLWRESVRRVQASL
jgi:hypothetical protein